MTVETTYNALFICTGNSARSIMAEGILNGLGQGRFRAYSAGSHPKGEVHPMALAKLQDMRMPATGYRSKSWDAFAAPGAPHMTNAQLAQKPADEQPVFLIPGTALSR
jgi:protein-tyrosine-phosphatase